jgi:hypothetical protein
MMRALSGRVSERVEAAEPFANPVPTGERLAHQLTSLSHCRPDSDRPTFGSPATTSDEERRAPEQHDGQRDLGDDEHCTRATSAARRAAAAGALVEHGRDGGTGSL